MKSTLDAPIVGSETYRRIRRAIGYIGIGLPLVLILCSWMKIFVTEFHPSLSHYYYTDLRDIFTGSLCAVGLFLVRYDGHKNPVIWKNDRLLTNIAGFMAFGIAIFPTDPLEGTCKLFTLVTHNHEFWKWLHYAFAAIFLLVLALISYCVFPIGQMKIEGHNPSVVNENFIYKTCAIFMLICIGLIPLFDSLKVFNSSTLVLEAIAMFMFGMSWLVKGRALGDKGRVGEVLYNERN